MSLIYLTTAVIIIGLAINLLVKFYPIYRDRRLLKTVTQLNRGTDSERQLILKLLKNGIHCDAIYHDLIIETHPGKSHQIDLVIATTQGLIVVEVKDYSGWIFGSANSQQWTKVLAYGNEKYQFYNPIWQNKGHIKAIKGLLDQLNIIPVFSIVAFSGSCELKSISYVPEGCWVVKTDRILEAIERIQLDNPPAPYKDKREIINTLKSISAKSSDAYLQSKHNQHIRDILGEDRILR